MVNFCKLSAYTEKFWSNFIDFQNSFQQFRDCPFKKRRVIKHVSCSTPWLFFPHLIRSTIANRDFKKLFEARCATFCIDLPSIWIHSLKVVTNEKQGGFGRVANERCWSRLDVRWSFKSSRHLVLIIFPFLVTPSSQINSHWPAE
jgi:hypothetical protein